MARLASMIELSRVSALAVDGTSGTLVAIDDRGVSVAPGSLYNDRAEDADIIVVNTCSFIDTAKQESVNTILEMAEIKQTGRAKQLVVAGCLVERYRDELKREIPEIDALVGVNQLTEIETIVALNAPRSLLIYSDGASVPELYLYDETTPRLRATAPYTAYVKIAEGCDHTCAFCIIPKLRGVFRSRSPESILHEVEALAAQGVKEFVLISQDTTAYGTDFNLRDGLARLVESISHVPGVEWVRFLYGYPTHITDELLRVMAERPNVCKYFDIPLQHASRRVLQRMRRGGARVAYERLIARIRERVPGVAVRTTFIAGSTWSITVGEYSAPRRTLPTRSFAPRATASLTRASKCCAAEASMTVPMSTFGSIGSP